MNYAPTMICPWCGRKTVHHSDGIFGWRKCPAVKSCGWDVFQDDAAKGKHVLAVADAFTPPNPFGHSVKA